MTLAVALVEVVIGLTAFLLALNYFRNKKDPRFPPGPRSLPIIGNLLQFGSKPQLRLSEWAKEFGPIFSMKMGSNDVIVLSDHKIIKEVFQANSASGRSPNPVLLAFGGGNYGIIMNEGSHWENQRRFALRRLRDYGFAKKSMENSILDEVSSMIKWFEKRLDKPISGNKIFNGAVVNSLWNIISSERQEWDSDEPPPMLKHAEEIITSINLMNSTGLLFAPSLRFIAPEYFGWNKWINGIAKVTEIANQSVQRHLRELNWDQPQDFIDEYLIEKQKATDPSSSFYGDEGDKNLRALIPDLFLAGSETTSHTLSWSLLLLAHNQSKQKKLHEELDAVIGQNRLPSVEDRPNLPYTEAVVNETLRKTSVVNSGVPHKMIQDTLIQGYFFPKNATIISNLYYVNNDPKIWGDPENFRPERFLSPDGKKFVKHEALIPFSTGRRVCVGESLARDTLFLFIASIFQRFHVKMDPNDSCQAIEEIYPTNKFLNEPSPFTVIVSAR